MGHGEMGWWTKFYDEGFKHELVKFREIVEGGETNPYRAINLFQLWEQTHQRQYNDGPGTFFYTDKDFTNAESLFPTGKPVLSSTFLGGEVAKLPYYTKKHIGLFILDYLEHEDLAVDAIVELGAGWGRYLFELYFSGSPSDIALVSGEVSPEARQITEVLCGLDPEMPITAHDFDFYHPKLDFLKGRESVLFFTHMAIMFIPELQRQAIIEMAASAKRVRCIHFEPVGFQVSSGQYKATKLQRAAAVDKGFNRNLIALLEELHNEDRITLRGLYKDIIFDVDRTQAISVVIWEGGSG